MRLYKEGSWMYTRELYVYVFNGDASGTLPWYAQGTIDDICVVYHCSECVDTYSLLHCHACYFRCFLGSVLGFSSGIS